MPEKLDKADLSLAANAEILHQKNKILKNISLRLNRLGKRSEQEHPITESKFAKVSRGENLKGLPYLVLDFPRIFTKENIFAFRTLFWWGNYVSCTLHLKGTYLNNFAHLLHPLIEKLANDQFRFSIDGDEWNHDSSLANFKNVKLFEAEQLNLEKMEFLKITSTLPLLQLNDLEDFYTTTFDTLLKPLLNEQH